MNSIMYAVFLFAIGLLNACGADSVNADEYLEKFGYMDRAAHRSGNPHLRAAAKTRAVRAFQEFAHLPVTGVLDEETKEKMLAPRCGMSDRTPKTRASFLSKWEKDVITWKLVKGTTQLDSGSIRRAIHESFAVWSKVIPLNFTEVSSNAESDMQFSFGTKDHGDSYVFDGPGGVLAHAFYPKHGGLHFDDEEKWTYQDASQIKEGGYVDLLSVTIHEMGHALGLPHLKEQQAIMFPFYRHPELDEKDQLKPFVLSQFDINAIQEAYGPREGATPRPTTPTTPAPTPEPTPPGGPSTGAACPRFQATVTGADGATYFFNGNIGWTKADVLRGAPNSATRFYLDRRFPNAPSYVTAAVTDMIRSSQTYLFQGRRVWGYSWDSSTGRFTLAEGFPKDLQNDVPFTPEGALQLKGNSHIILFQGDDFVIWEPTRNEGSFHHKISGYFGTFPSKTSFNEYNQDNVFFLNGNGYQVFDTDERRLVRSAPLNQLITC